ncbi:ABC transporter ATP-binding protein [Limoniibacter endophyticus]|uniref:ABC transporter n=1 Tax=Limoniibacter endophyticus TaxID=1565040 RepID=A0A8J3DGG2_9HYPH|nr:ABC transporter ATP-binding protein [Limoniibacter endophyticus]GHC63851.1 ABC transporter [Limoniibacter endophyticus]
MSNIRVHELTKIFGKTVALDHINLDLPQGSFTALLGPSGCGKTTLLRLLAGFEQPDEGSIHFGDRCVASEREHVAPEARHIGVVFQSYALWPHMNAAENIVYPLKTRKVPAEKIAAKLEEVLGVVGLKGLEGRNIEQLSGGQRQRVALARCLIADSRIILFDEPLANLDMHLRASMVEALRDIRERTGATMVYVTHDQTEALALADKIAVMEKGEIIQFGTPEEIYTTPGRESVARFVGRGGLVPARQIAGGGDKPARILVAGQELDVRGYGGQGEVRVLLRPEDLSIAEAGVPATVVQSIYRGPVHELRLRIDGTDAEVLIDNRSNIIPGSAVYVAVKDGWILPR